MSLADTLGLRHVRHFDGTDLGGATYVSSSVTAAREQAEPATPASSSRRWPAFLVAGCSTGRLQGRTRL